MPRPVAPGPTPGPAGPGPDARCPDVPRPRPQADDARPTPGPLGGVPKPVTMMPDRSDADDEAGVQIGPTPPVPTQQMSMPVTPVR